MYMYKYIITYTLYMYSTCRNWVLHDECFSFSDDTNSYNYINIHFVVPRVMV